MFNKNKKATEEIIDKEKIIEDYKTNAKKVSCLTQKLIENKEKMENIIKEILGSGVRGIKFDSDIITVQYSEYNTLTLESLKKLEEVLDSKITLRAGQTFEYGYCPTYTPIIKIEIQYGCE